MNKQSQQHLEPWLGDRAFDDWRAEFDDTGYLVFPSVLAEQELTAIREALQPYLDADLHGRNDFEGLKTNRIYAMLAKSPVFAELCLHPLALAFVEAEFGLSARLSACLGINLQPGESVQPWHHDDAHITVPLPHAPFGVSAFWAIDETTEENGATQILPGSHKWSIAEFNGTLKAQHFENQTDVDVADDPGYRADALSVCLPAGSLMLAKSNLWHRGGANCSAASRLIITPQYCAGWARQLENMLLAVPPEIAKTLPQRAQELLGYGIHPPFMGYVDGMHPMRVLGAKS